MKFVQSQKSKDTTIMCETCSNLVIKHQNNVRTFETFAHSPPIFL